MIYVDADGNRVDASYSDGRRGEWVETSVVSAHHDGRPGKPPVTRAVPNGVVFLEDGSVFQADPDDPSQLAQVAALKAGDSFGGSTVRALMDGEVVVEPGIEPVEPWDEYEDAMAWREYTQAEVDAAERAEEVSRANAEAEALRLREYSDLKSAVSDLNELMAELVAGDGSEPTGV